MAASTSDLPDPLQDDARESSADPDELLSKMADDAIDKLIADADDGRPPPAPGEQGTDDFFPAEAPPAPPSDDPATLPGAVAEPITPESAAPGFIAPESVAPESVAPEPVAPEPVASDPVAMDPDSMSAALSAEERRAINAGPETTDALAASLGAAPGNPPAGPTPLPMPPAVDVPLEHVEPAASAPEPAAEARPDVKALLADTPAGLPGLPGFLITPLEWLNAPFARLSDPVRNAMGQIGIVTLINALAVLLYVLIFRRGH